MSDLPRPDHARNMRLVAHSDQGGAGLFILEYGG